MSDEDNIAPKTRIAFVIDDWGYNKKNLDLLSQIDRPITIAILPNLFYSKEIALFASSNDKIDSILHLPLESKSGRAEEKYTIKEKMDNDEIIGILNNDIKNIPGVIGVSNHQGSKATENKKVMTVILSELKKKDLFFLDSLTTSDSVCLEVAKGIDLKYTGRDVFLDITDQTDLENFEDYVRKQINELIKIALEKGVAVGVGHNKKTTLEVIRDSIEDMESQGIEIVPLKEMIE